MPQKSIFRQPGAKHFQLVHRSQRDPLIHDPNASPHVLKEFERGNVKKGKTRSELESILSSELGHDRPNVGEASLYGIYYDDTDYDYMQHLRQVGIQEEDVDSVLIEAPSTSKLKSKGALSLEDLPAEALPSNSELPRNYESQEAIPSSIAGFQPDMDPHLRQVLEALEDDAFVDDDTGDDFFGELVNEGEREEGDDVAFEFDEDSMPGGLDGEASEDIEDNSFEARFARFKKEQKMESQPGGSGSGSDMVSEGGDTVTGLPKLPVTGGKRRRKGTSDASGYSMSSSSMFRTDALLTLDEQFDQVMAKAYALDEDQEDEAASDDSDEAPELITSREDFENLMNDFLDKYEILGRKMKPVLAGENGIEKLETLRRAMGQDKRVRIHDGSDHSDLEEEILMPFNVDDRKDRWDCETILTTYSNLENHPRLIRARDPRVTRIILDPKTGMPSAKPQENKLRKLPEIEENHPVRQTVTRPRDESKNEKKARKQAVKAERQTRRADKKATKEQFSNEFKQQTKGIANKEAKVRKL